MLGVEIRGMHGVPRMTVLYFPGQNNRTVKDPHQEYDVISVRIHEKYMTNIYDYGFDIALLKLARPVFPVFGKIGMPSSSMRTRSSGKGLLYHG